MVAPRLLRRLALAGALLAAVLVTSGGAQLPDRRPRLPPDRGVKLARMQADFDYDPAAGTYGVDVRRSRGQPALTWDGLVRFSAKTVPEGAGQYYGLVAELIDYRGFAQHPNGTVGWAYRSDDAGAHPDGFPVWKALFYDTLGEVYSTHQLAPFSDWRMTLDDPTRNPTGAGTGLTYLFHFQVLPNPERSGENPYLSDASGGPPDGTLHMTYDYLLLASVILQPASYDADFFAGHEFHATSERQRLVTGLGSLTVRFERGAGAQRVPVAITAGGVDPATFGVLQTSGSAPGSRRVLRGYEPGMTRDGNVVVFQSQLRRYSSDPAAPQPGTGHVVFARRLQGSFSNPDDPVLPLRFSEPESIANLAAYAGAVVPMTYGPGPDPRPPLTYGERYPLFRHRLLTPLGDHVYAQDEPVGGAYPWISLDGSYLVFSTGFGVGHYLDLTPQTQSVHTNGGIEYALEAGVKFPAATFQPFPQRREGYVLVGEDLVADDGAERYLQLRVLDGPLNETRRAFARVTLSALRLDGPWSPAYRLPRAHLDAARVQAEGPVTAMYLRVANQGEGTPFTGVAPRTLYGELAHPAARGNYLLYTSLVAAGTWIPDLDLDPNVPGAPHPNRPPDPPPPTNYSRYGTALLTDFTRAVDDSGNGLRVDLNYGGPGGGGAFYPFDDPVGVYGGPDRDNERELQVGRVGQGVYLSSDGQITVSEGARSRPGTLADYDDELAVHLWYRPLSSNAGATLARGPAFELRVDGGGLPQVTAHVADGTGARVSRTVRAPAAFGVGGWYHLAANLRLDGARRRLRLELFVNGRCVRDARFDLGSAAAAGLWHDPSPLRFGPGGPGQVADRVMILDELAVSNRCLSEDEVRRVALVVPPRVDSGPGGANSLGPLLSVILAAGLDPDEAYVPPDNPATREKIDLGRLLFFERRLSSDGTLSCAGCHQPAAGFGDPDPLGTSAGVGGARGKRHTPHIVNRVFQRPGDRFLWDGRAGSLEEQVLLPIANPREMNLPLAAAVQVVRGNPLDYDAAVRAAFGHPAAAFDVTELAAALATYVRSLVVGDSNAERHAGGDASALTPAQELGLGVFQTSCIACHHGAAASDGGFHDVGLYDLTGPSPDLGRQAVTGLDADRGAFRTPGLRDLYLRAATLGHDGTLDLATIVESYSRGGLFRGINGTADPFVRPLHLTAAEKAGLLDFLTSGLRSNFDGVYAETDPWTSR